MCTVNIQTKFYLYLFPGGQLYEVFLLPFVDKLNCITGSFKGFRGIISLSMCSFPITCKEKIRLFSLFKELNPRTPSNLLR